MQTWLWDAWVTQASCFSSGRVRVCTTASTMLTQFRAFECYTSTSRSYCLWHSAVCVTVLLYFESPKHSSFYIPRFASTRKFNVVGVTAVLPGLGLPWTEILAVAGEGSIQNTSVWLVKQDVDTLELVFSCSHYGMAVSGLPVWCLWLLLVVVLYFELQCL